MSTILSYLAFAWVFLFYAANSTQPHLIYLTALVSSYSEAPPWETTTVKVFLQNNASVLIIQNPQVLLILLVHLADDAGHCAE